MTPTRTGPSRSPGTRPLADWVGDSLWRRFVAWLIRTALVAVVIAIALAVVWLVAVPWVVSGYREFFIGR